MKYFEPVWQWPLLQKRDYDLTSIMIVTSSFMCQLLDEISFSTLRILSSTGTVKEYLLKHITGSSKKQLVSKESLSSDDERDITELGAVAELSQPSRALSSVINVFYGGVRALFFPLLHRRVVQLLGSHNRNCALFVDWTDGTEGGVSRTERRTPGKERDMTIQSHLNHFPTTDGFYLRDSEIATSCIIYH